MVIVSQIKIIVAKFLKHFEVKPNSSTLVLGWETLEEVCRFDIFGPNGTGPLVLNKYEDQGQHFFGGLIFTTWQQRKIKCNSYKGLLFEKNAPKPSDLEESFF
jgi:hypothetical protein